MGVDHTRVVARLPDTALQGGGGAIFRRRCGEWERPLGQRRRGDGDPLRAAPAPATGRPSGWRRGRWGSPPGGGGAGMDGDRGRRRGHRMGWAERIGFHVFYVPVWDPRQRVRRVHQLFRVRRERDKNPVGWVRPSGVIKAFPSVSIFPVGF